MPASTRLAVATALGLVLTACGGGGSSGGGGGGTAICTVAAGGGTVAVSGVAQYQRVPHTAGHALDYANITTMPIRGAVVQVRRGTGSTACAAGVVLGTGETDASGAYSINVTQNEDAKVCVRAELQHPDTGPAAPSWDVQVIDNTQAGALYILETAGFCSGTTPQTQNLTATTGWGGTGYTGTRAAAPFAILDSIYQAIQKILTVEPTADFDALDLNWSVNNTDTDGSLTAGQIGTTFYSTDAIYVLGDDNNDTDEFDDHVIIHEFGHYVEDNFSRADSIGGSHGGGDLLDMRVAYGEGFGNAWSGIVTDNPVYEDSFGSQQGSGFDINVESDTLASGLEGWYSETTVQGLLYDLYDSTADTQTVASTFTDNTALGLQPLWDVWVGTQRTAASLTSIHSFLDGLRSANAGQAAAITALANARNINGSDQWGTGETHGGGLNLSPAANCTAVDRALPVFIGYTPGVTGIINVPSTKLEGEYNKLGNRRFIAFTLGSAGSHSFTVTSVTGQDPDAYLYRSGVLVGTAHESNGDEAWTEIGMPAGTYVLEVYPFTNIDQPFGINGTGGEICLQVNIT